MKFTVQFEIFGKKMQSVVTATSEEDAKYKILGAISAKVRWGKIEKQSDNMFEHLKDMMGIK